MQMSDSSNSPAKAPVEPVTLVVTSCRRFDNLRATLASFAATNTYPLHKAIVVEDSDDTEVYKVADEFPELNLDVRLNGRNLTQFPSIDRVYQTIETEFIFHCEDDWEFLRPGIIEESLTLMQAYPETVVVWPRGDGGAPSWVRRNPVSEDFGIRHRWIDPRAHHTWGSFTFNPGLRRLSHYKRLPGGYSAHFEGGTSIAYKRMVLYMTVLQDTGIRHTGAEVSTHGPQLDRWTKLKRRVQRLPLSTRLKLSHWWWTQTARPAPMPPKRG